MIRKALYRLLFFSDHMINLKNGINLLEAFWKHFWLFIFGVLELLKSSHFGNPFKKSGCFFLAAFSFNSSLNVATCLMCVVFLYSNSLSAPLCFMLFQRSSHEAPARKDVDPPCRHFHQRLPVCACQSRVRERAPPYRQKSRVFVVSSFAGGGGLYPPCPTRKKNSRLWRPQS